MISFKPTTTQIEASSLKSNCIERASTAVFGKGPFPAGDASQRNTILIKRDIKDLPKPSAIRLYRTRKSTIVGFPKARQFLNAAAAEHEAFETFEFQVCSDIGEKSLVGILPSSGGECMQEIASSGKKGE